MGTCLMFRWLRSALFSILCGLFYGKTALAGIHLSFSGWYSKNEVPLSVTSKGSASESLAFDVFSCLRLGGTARQELSDVAGYSFKEATQSYIPYHIVQKVHSYSVDLTAILYPGNSFVPFIFLGMGRKHYEQKIEMGNEPPETAEAWAPTWQPNGGGGFALRIGPRVSFKITHTLSLGQGASPGDIEPHGTYDSYTEFGLTFLL